MSTSMFPSENQTIEYKESWRDEYLKWICGFQTIKETFEAEKLSVPKFVVEQGGLAAVIQRERFVASTMNVGVNVSVNGVNGNAELTDRQKVIYQLLNRGSSNDTINDTVNDTQDCTKDCTKQITDRQGVIVRLVELSATITIPEIARKTSISERTIKSEMKALQELGLLRRVGGRKTGHWEVVKE